MASAKTRRFLKRLLSHKKIKASPLEINALGSEDSLDQSLPVHKSEPPSYTKATESDSSPPLLTKHKTPACPLHCQINPQTGTCAPYQTIHRSLSHLLSLDSGPHPEKWHQPSVHEEMTSVRTFLFHSLCQEYSVPETFHPKLPRTYYNGFIWIANLITQRASFRATPSCQSPNRPEVSIFWDQHVYHRLLRLFFIPCKVLGLTDSHAEQIASWFLIREVKKNSARPVGSCVRTMIRRGYHAAVEHRLAADERVAHVVGPCAARPALLAAVRRAREHSGPAFDMEGAPTSRVVRMPSAVSLVGAQFDGGECYEWCEEVGSAAKGAIA